jgi:hypothetical protein
MMKKGVFFMAALAMTAVLFLACASSPALAQPPAPAAPAARVNPAAQERFDYLDRQLQAESPVKPAEIRNGSPPLNRNEALS